ncbi:MAG: hypothetical protein CLLPBCKN_000423 [Chroococcidiopsis cubana SAG 39.79]|jgi:hypothetical protein|uniref:hypothetical protein n=1 Tax=Chroococcidiopsis cubana TaxID=171392 RepID=UPI0015E70FDD|nr:hypothetical protein [Chroococcidiopsis cubana]MDZ4871035.1 hypothetical protein [Chroococcidiopsis cubana SAG 39.79]
MTHLLVQSRNDSEHEGTPQTDSLRDSSVNHTLPRDRARSCPVAENLLIQYKLITFALTPSQTTFATQPTILKRSGAARLLGCALTCT